LGPPEKKDGENSSIRNIAAVNYILSEGIIRPATTALARDRPAQANISIRNPKINAWEIEWRISAAVTESKPGGSSRPASLLAFDRTY
jgi:hypothetical protein